jgi:SAM-dependent methyltransferase
MGDAGRDLTDTGFWDRRYADGPKRRRPGNVAEEERTALWRRLMAIPGLSSGVALELGCAPGRILERLARAAPHFTYHGLDYSRPGLEACKKALADAGIQAELHEGDLWTTELALPYDVVVSAGLIEHFDDPAAILRRHGDFAREGGWVIVTVPNWTHPWFNRAVTIGLRPDTFATHNPATMDPDALGRAMREAGFTDVRTGRGGGAFVTTVRESATLRARALQAVARAWNVTLALAPPLRRCWGSLVWAAGRKPDGAVAAADPSLAERGAEPLKELAEGNGESPVPQ